MRLRGMILPWLALLLILATALPARAGEDGEGPVPARGYVLVQAAGQSGWLPLPDREEDSYTFPIRQMTQDGKIVENLVRVTPEGMYMESANCENQDCVHQGMVTLENRNTRVLMNFILCLPHQVSLALYTPDEILAMYSSGQGTAEGE